MVCVCATLAQEIVEDPDPRRLACTRVLPQQVFFECQTSSGVGVERVVTLGKHETKAAPSNKDPGPGRLQEHRYSHDTCGKGGSNFPHLHISPPSRYTVLFGDRFSTLILAEYIFCVRVSEHVLRQP